ncbi:uracil-DNA glycosylase family protein [Cyclobacterium jeungdonense]|uniref:Uracil-DNA glycosylase family protein n=1 Tax=Cyclobacterium jeungdonense TaxID=708087 RepID=A0ABT8C8M1_9BACT|nr:uracil-DNA glycosylase family protein [Cyclobacterium jeungdonense]MDN3688716.1 uracil-DNA glycosylase family protein [Cyclobacterium jeungdonense]
MKELLETIKGCTLCEAHLPLGPNPVLAASRSSSVLVIGQAPGTKVHATGIPWNDASGKELRRWLGVSPELFYDPAIFGIVPMGFCYPGRGKGGDLPPRPECAPTWHPALLEKMPGIKLKLLIGQYAQRYYLGKERKKNLTETVRDFRDYLPEFFPLVHPSPRNKLWQKRNPWFEEEVVPALRNQMESIL